MIDEPKSPPSKPAGAAGLGCVRILHLEDSPLDAELVQSILEHDGLTCDITVVPTRSSFEAALGLKPFDLVICDHGIPGYDGFTALRLARKVQPDAPVIMVSGSIDEAQAVESLHTGAIDYILKQRLARLAPAIRRALRDSEDRKVRAAAEDRIREQANLLNLTTDAIVVRSLDDRVLFWNKGAETVFGWAEAEATGREFSALTHGDRERREQARATLLAGGTWLGEFQLRHRNGEEIVIFSRWNLLRGKDGQPRAILSANTDITERKKLEAAFLRAQRMDSIGALAGGIAHDLNNALAPVLMSADMLRNCDDDASRDRFLDIIASGSERAIGMVKQILGFARGAAGEPGPLFLGQLVTEMVKIVRDTFPKSVLIKMNTGGENLWQIRGDPTELHQVMLNLCVNARDAMPKGGRLTLAAENVRLDEAAASALRAPAGPYVLLTVADTGSGIPPEVLPRIFEPFFTTKSADKGTGLGLSTVAGIIKRHHGVMDIQTEAGRGTAFRVYFPALEAPEPKEAAAAKPSLPAGHGELVLIMDDEEAVRELTKATLESYGYTVVTAQNGVQGVTCFEQNKDRIRLVVSDTDMPVMDGMTAVRAIKQIRPDVPIIVASGAQRNLDQWRSIDSKHLTNLGKPYNLEQLLVAVAMAVQQ